MESSTLDIMYNPMAWYGRITVDCIKVREKSLQDPFDTSHPVDVFFNHINDGVQYANKKNTMFVPSQVLQIDYHAVRSFVV